MTARFDFSVNIFKGHHALRLEFLDASEVSGLKKYLLKDLFIICHLNRTC